LVYENVRMIIKLRKKRIQAISQWQIFLRVSPTRWRRKLAGVDMNRNYVTVTLCVSLWSGDKFDVFCMFVREAYRTFKWKDAISLFPGLQGSAGTQISWLIEVGNYTVFQSPAFCETFIPKVIKIPQRILELQLKCRGPFLWDEAYRLGQENDTTNSWP